MARTKPWEVSDEVWERVRQLIPAAPSHAKGDDEEWMIARPLRPSCLCCARASGWNALPRELGASASGA